MTKHCQIHHPQPCWSCFAATHEVSARERRLRSGPVTVAGCSCGWLGFERPASPFEHYAHVVEQWRRYIS